MSSAWREHLTHDHRRLVALLAAAEVDPAAFDEFRGLLLTHIAVEEKLLMPLLDGNDEERALRRALRADHAALAALTIPTPRAEHLATIEAILTRHEPLEEAEGGLYPRLELAAPEISIDAVSPPAPSPHRDGPAIERHIRWSLCEAEKAHSALLWRPE